MHQSDGSAFIPTKLDIFALFFISAILLIIINIKQLLAFLANDTETDIGAEVFPLIQQFLLDKLSWITANVATFLFWLLAGYLILMAAEVLVWLFRLYRHDLPTMNLLQSTVRNNAVKDIALHFIVRTVALLGLVAWSVWFFVGTLPLTNRLFLDGLERGVDIYKTLLACALLGLYFYLAGVLLRFLILRRHLL